MVVPVSMEERTKASKNLQDFIVSHVQPCELASHVDRKVTDEASVEQILQILEPHQAEAMFEPWEV